MCKLIYYYSYLNRFVTPICASNRDEFIRNMRIKDPNYYHKIERNREYFKCKYDSNEVIIDWHRSRDDHYIVIVGDDYISCEEFVNLFNSVEYSMEKE